MWYFSYLLCDLVRQCGISLIYCVNWYYSEIREIPHCRTSSHNWYFSYLLCEMVRQCGISLIYCVIWYDNVAFLFSIVWTGTTCGISLIYCVNWYDSVVFLLSIVWTGTTIVVYLLSIVWSGTTMSYFSYLLCDLVRQWDKRNTTLSYQFTQQIREIPHCRPSSHNR